MFKNIKNISILSAVLLGVSCSSSVDFSEFTAGYDKAIQKSTERNVLLNIVRSSRNQPLHFTSISGVIPNLFISFPLGVKYFATVTVSPEPSTKVLID